MKKTPVEIKIEESGLFHSMPDILRQRGSVLIALIVVMVIFAMLGSALVVMFSTSTLHQVRADQGMRAYYLAESGYRYAAGEFLNGGTGEDRDTVLSVLNGKEFLFGGNNGAFELEIESYFYDFKDLNGSTLTVEVFGEMPETIPTNGTGVSGTLAVFGDPTFYHAFNGYRMETGEEGSELRFSLTGTASPAGTRVFPALAGNGSQTMTKGSDISFTGADVLFPPSNGAFRIYDALGNEKDSTIFAYDEIDTSANTLTGIRDIMNPENGFSVAFDATDYIVLQRFVNLTSTGRFGDLDSSFASKTLTYAVPLEAIKTGGAGGTEIIGGDELLEALAENDSGTGLGEFEIQKVGGDTALAVTKTTGGSGKGNQTRVEAVVGLPDGEDSPFYAAWLSRGHFLNYDAQVKVAGGSPDSGGTFFDKPDYYLSGISFRLSGDSAGTLRSYGLSFMRTTTGTGNSSDGIPDYLLPDSSLEGTPMVVLWDRGGRGTSGGDEWMAYMELSPNDPVLDQPPAGNDRGVWASNLTYIVNDIVTHGGIEYICISSHTSTDTGKNSNEPGEGKKWETFWNLRANGAIHLSDWATIMVRVLEAASIRYEGTTAITTGNTVTGKTSGATGEVIKKIETDTGEIVLLNNVSGTFQRYEQLVGTAVTIKEWRERDNYIWAFYGDQSDHGTANTSPLDVTNRLGNPRSGDIHWSVDNVDDWAADNDYFTLVQWNGTLNTGSYSDMVRLGKGKELYAIIRTNLYVTPDDVYDYPPELGVHSLGESASLSYFDDFGAKISGKSGEERAVGFLSPIVQQE